MQTLLDQIDELGIADCNGRSALPSFDFVCSLAEEFASSDRVQREQSAFVDGSKRETVKQFLIKYQERQEFTEDHPLYRAGVELAPIAANMLGGCKYISADMWYAVPNGSSRPREWSQNWHRDPEADRVIKAMLFIRDVNDEAGPFEYVPKSHKNYYDVCPAKTYLKPGAVIDAQAMRVICPAGTLIFANTSGLHRGGYTRSKARLSCVWTYVPANSNCQFKFSLN